MTVTDGPAHPESGHAVMRERIRGNPLKALGALGITLFILGYPFLIEWVLTHVSVRIVAMVLVAFAVASTVARFSGKRNPYYDLGWGPGVLFAALALYASITGDRGSLLLVPAVIYLAITWLCVRSFEGGGSIIESMARFIEPTAPPFIRSYCRKVTIVWMVLFLIHAAVITYLALAAPIEAWSAYTGWIAFAIMGALGIVEFLVRKWWFRNYFYGHLFDRVFSALFPAEATPQGRQSLEHIRRFRSDV